MYGTFPVVLLASLSGTQAQETSDHHTNSNRTQINESVKERNNKGQPQGMHEIDEPGGVA